MILFKHKICYAIKWYQIISILKSCIISCIELLLVYLISALGFVSSVQIFALILFFVFFHIFQCVLCITSYNFHLINHQLSSAVNINHQLSSAVNISAICLMFRKSFRSIVLKRHFCSVLHLALSSMINFKKPQVAQ